MDYSLIRVEVPVVQAPMGWIVRSQLASAVSNAGALELLRRLQENWTIFVKKSLRCGILLINPLA